MVRVALALTLALATTAATPARADDEGSEHSAALVGATADTLGFTVTFAPKTGWTMDVRAKPGAALRTVRLALPVHHAHYVAYVLPGRTGIAFVESSAGVTTARPRPVAADRLAWLFAPDGKLVRSWTYGEVMTKPELASLPRSISHYPWLRDHKVTATGLELGLGRRTLVFDAKARTLR